MQTTTCPLCNAVAMLCFKNLQGYSEGDFYDVYECGHCDTSFVSPLKTSNELYEKIYQQAPIMPGYERYYRYMNLVKRSRNPLHILRNAEDMYWSMAKALEEHFPDKNASILEIGSGLGYSTYALTQAGYKVTGVDISTTAVQDATKRFGEHYTANDLFQLAHEQTNTYDCVIMLEVIEHVENPKNFIEAALRLLKPGGKLILTTPNKSSAPRPTVWHGDVPPVHLWFFSELSIRYLAESFGCAANFIDFTDFNNKFHNLQYIGTASTFQNRPPLLDKNGNLFPQYKVSNFKTKLFSTWGRYYISYILRRLKPKNKGPRSTSLCAVITKI